MNHELMTNLAGRVIRVDRGGPESRVGRLVDFGEDYIVILTDDDGVVYYNLRHVKSITHDTKAGLSLQNEFPETFECIRGSDFKSVIEEMLEFWVKVNRGGPEKIEGILYEVNDDFITLVSKEEIIRLSLFHIRNISYGLLAPIEDNDNDNENGNNQNDNGRRNRRRR